MKSPTGKMIVLAFVAVYLTAATAPDIMPK